LKKKLTITILSFLIFSDFLETFTNFCFKKSALNADRLGISSFSELIIFLKTVSLSPYLWIAFLSVFLTFVIWSTILSKIDLSVAVPIASFSYILVPVVSIIFLHEQIGLLRWLGILLILTGVIFVSLSTEEKGVL
jgi:undecaprenyl phosphate-alpha-L-ara4N flippase subunit ArnE